MNLRITRYPHFFLFIFILFTSNVFSQCFEIQSILVDACGGTLEGRNEMVRFKVGSAPLNINTLTVTWPNNSWLGVVQNAATALIVTQLNADIIAAGGCGQILEPPGGILPADATAILVTSYLMTPSANSFGPLSETVYMVFQNSTISTGHFANQSNTPLANARSLVMNFVGSCSDTVTYDKSLLTDLNGNNNPADGATANFTPAGVVSYTNNGCKAPVPPFTVDAGPLTLTACAGSTITLNGAAVGQQSVAWSSPSGVFVSPTSTSTDYTVPAAAGGTTIALTLQATNSCGLQITDIINVSVTTNVTPNFATTLNLCSSDTAPVLALTSPNGISGTWNPTVINTTTSGNYIFTPTAGQCATTTTLAVTITPETTPNLATTLTLCGSDTAPALALTSPNGISGTWNPAVISTTVSGNYIFTPNAGQCATTATLAVTINPETTPNFAATLNLCSSDVVPILALTSPNGISGTWNPTVINTTTSGNYIFTPTVGQCATTTTLAVTITPETTPNFAATLNLCSSDVVPTLALTSPNGISGTWNPTVINTTTSGNYIFTPTVGQCATTATLAVTITPETTPNFAPTLTLCSSDTAPVLALTSPNGISGTWNPAVINTTTSGNYIFTPTAGQCATTTTLAVTITPETTPNFATTLNLCSSDTAPVLALTSPNGISGTWNPAVINTTTSGNYIFTPTAGQCATTTTLAVTITPETTPNFATTLNLCSSDTAPILALTSPNGISGTWNPAVINTTTSGNYIFTPNVGQCAVAITLVVDVTPISYTITQECVDNKYLIKAKTESSAFNYTFTWFNEKGDQIGSHNETFDFTEYSKNYNDQLLFPLQFKVIVSNGSCESEQLFEIANNLCGVPNAVSPNGDGINDTFDLTEFNVTTLAIYNRWGRKVYDFHGKYDQQWHGQWTEGNILPTGTYYYIISSENGDQKAGWVFLSY